jgi:adenylate cyclase
MHVRFFMRPSRPREPGLSSRWGWLARLRPRLARLAAYGTEGYPLPVQRRLKILNVVAYLIAFFTFAYAAQHLFVDAKLWAPIIIINASLAFVALTVPFLHRFNDVAGGLTIAVAEFVALFTLTAHLGRDSGIHVQYIAFAAAPFLVLGLTRLKLVLALVVIGFALHVAAWFMFPEQKALLHVAKFELDSVYVTAAVTTFGLIAATVYYAFHLAERAEAETDALLRNILPEPIVERLKAAPGATIADTFEDASVLFADLKGFVSLAKVLGPARTVEFLNRLMTEFDTLAAKHGVEKIKTIGDAYMVAAGVPQALPDHAERLAGMALDMLAAIGRAASEAHQPLAARIGIASGPMMGGVIGAKRLTYDVWGDTVNLAARLESSGEPGRVHVSARTKALLEGAYHLENRGQIEIRGLGAEQTWYLVGLRTAARALDPAIRPEASDVLTPSRP